AHAREAIAQAALQRAERLPLQAIDRIARRMGLRDDAARQVLAGIVVVALLAGEVDLPLPPNERCPSRFDEALRLVVPRDRYRHAAGLLAYVGGQGEQVFAFVRQRLGALVVDAACVDPLLDVHRIFFVGSDGRIARRDALHAFGGIAMAVGAGLLHGARFLVPERLAV